MKKFPWYLNAFFLFCLAYAVCSVTSCATAPCRPAHEVMRDQGVVLECFNKPYPDTGEPAARCLILPSHGHAVVRTVFALHCGL